MMNKWQMCIVCHFFTIMGGGSNPHPARIGIGAVMTTTQKSFTEYHIDRDFALWLLEADESTEVYLHHKRTKNTKLINRLDPDIKDLEKVILDEVSSLSDKKEDSMFDVSVNPAHLVETVSELWESSRGENEFLTNIAYMVISSIMNGYRKMWESDRKWALEDSDPDIAMGKAIQKLGKMLESVEHNSGKVNAASRYDEKPDV